MTQALEDIQSTLNKPEPIYENILEVADRLTSEDRRKQYGHPLDDFMCTAALMTAVLKSAGLLDPTKEISPEMAELLMICTKISRLSRNTHHLDTITDIAGYARVMQLTTEERQARWASAAKERK